MPFYNVQRIQGTMRTTLTNDNDLLCPHYIAYSNVLNVSNVQSQLTNHIFFTDTGSGPAPYSSESVFGLTFDVLKSYSHKTSLNLRCL